MVTSGPADWAPVILALGSFVSATAGAIVVLYNALRSKRMEAKLDAAEVVRTQIHKAVNGDRDRDRAKIVELEAEVTRLRALPPPPFSDH